MVDVKIKKPTGSGAQEEKVKPEPVEEKKEPNIWTLVETKKKEDGADNTG